MSEKAVQQWFDEALAVVVSDDPRYLKTEGTADRCTAEPIAKDKDFATASR